MSGTSGGESANASRWAAWVAALAGLGVGLVQYRAGVIHLLDTVTYWSGIEAVSRGDLFRTGLAPSFSNFSAAEFAARSGDLPFVDFPIGYPLVAGVFATVLGARSAMRIVCLVALAVLAAFAVTLDGPSGRSRARAAILAVFAALLVTTPAMRLVTQGALSEPLFCAVTVAFVGSVVRFRSHGRAAPMLILGSVVGLLRFIGAPLAFVAGWEYARRTGDRVRAAALTVVMLLPAATNILVARAAGGGHGAGWRGLDRTDLEVTVRSVGGWLDARQGDIRRTYFTDDGPSWWSWPLAALWLVAVVIAVLVFVWGRRGRLERIARHLSAPSEIALVCAGIVWSGLIAGMAGFDALVIADNRLMLPVGLLTLLAAVWSVRDTRLLAVIVVLFAVAAARPWNVGESFADNSDGDLVSRAAIASGATLVVSNNADAVHWDTGIPAAYVPLPVKPLTGETVDVETEYARLPCALLGADGAVVLSVDATFSAARTDLLDLEVEAGHLELQVLDGASVYYPTASACD